MLIHNQVFESRTEIGKLLGGDVRKGIATTRKSILLFTNDQEVYTDFFYPKNTYDYCMYTGIGREGHQDSINNNMYGLNIAVLNHTRDKRPLLVFEKRRIQGKLRYYFIGEYQLTETHQNIQPDDNGFLRRVFVFHLKKVSDTFKLN